MEQKNNTLKEEADIFYIVAGNLYKDNYHTENENDDKLFTVEKEFRGNNIATIRKAAVSYYESLIEVMLESKGLSYENDAQAQNDLKEFFFSGKKDKHKKIPVIEYDRDFGMCLMLLFCKTTDKPYITATGEKIYEKAKIIRYLGFQAEQQNQKIERNRKAEQQLLAPV